MRKMVLQRRAVDHDVNVAVVGLGMMGSIAPHILEQGTARIVAALGQTNEEVTNYMRINNFPDLELTGTFGDYHTLLTQLNVPVDLVYLATPNCMHAEMGKAAAKAGRHILFEKPLATTVEDAEAVMQATLENCVVAEINSQYRHTDVLTHQLREIISSGALTLQDGSKKEMGLVDEVEMGYIQGWQVDPHMNIGWRPWIDLAGKGKLTGDLGSHQVMTTHHLFGGEFVKFTGQRYNLHEYRWLDKAASAVTFTGGSGGSKVEKVRMDDIAASGDDRAYAEWTYRMPNDHEFKGKYRLSQVDAGNENHFYVSVKCEKGTITWFQEHPNQLFVEDKGYGLTRVYERGSAPSISGRPGGHSKGYGDMVLDESLDMIGAIRSQDPGIMRAFTERTMGQAVDAVRTVASRWNEPALIYGQDSAHIVDPGKQFYNFIQNCRFK